MGKATNREKLVVFVLNTYNAVYDFQKASDLRFIQRP